MANSKSGNNICKLHGGGTDERVLLQHHVISKLNRKDLEDHYYRVWDSNIGLKKRLNAMSEKIKILNTKLIRTEEQNKKGGTAYDRCNKYLEDIIDDQTFRIYLLEKNNKSLGEKVDTLKRQLYIQKLFSTNNKRRRSKTNSRIGSADSSKSGTIEKDFIHSPKNDLLYNEKADISSTSKSALEFKQMSDAVLNLEKQMESMREELKKEVNSKVDEQSFQTLSENDKELPKKDFSLSYISKGSEEKIISTINTKTQNAFVQTESDTNETDNFDVNEALCQELAEEKIKVLELQRQIKSTKMSQHIIFEVQNHLEVLKDKIDSKQSMKADICTMEDENKQLKEDLFNEEMKSTVLESVNNELKSKIISLQYQIDMLQLQFANAKPKMIDITTDTVGLHQNAIPQDESNRNENNLKIISLATNTTEDKVDKIIKIEKSVNFSKNESNSNKLEAPLSEIKSILKTDVILEKDDKKSPKEKALLPTLIHNDSDKLIEKKENVIESLKDNLNGKLSANIIEVPIENTILKEVPNLTKDVSNKPLSPEASVILAKKDMPTTVTELKQPAILSLNKTIIVEENENKCIENASSNTDKSFDDATYDISGKEEPSDANISVQDSTNDYLSDGEIQKDYAMSLKCDSNIVNMYSQYPPKKDTHSISDTIDKRQPFDVTDRVRHTLKAISKEMEQCRSILVLNYHDDDLKPVDMPKELLNDNANDSSKLLAKAEEITLSTDEVSEKKSATFILHIMSLEFSNEMKQELKDVSYFLTWQFFKQFIAYTPIHRNEVTDFDYCSSYAIQIDEISINYFLNERIQIDIHKNIADGSIIFATCSIELRNVLIHPNKKSTFSLALKRSVDKASDNSANLEKYCGNLVCWCQLNCDVNFLEKYSMSNLKSIKNDKQCE